MLEKFTINDILAILGTITALIAGIEFILVRMNKLLDKKLEPLNKKIDNLDETTCKNYLVRFMADVERGEEIDSAEEEHAFEVYDHYTNVLKKNSYIHTKWERVMSKKELEK